MPASSCGRGAARGGRPAELRTQRSLTDSALAKKAAARRDGQKNEAAVDVATPPATRIEALLQAGKKLYGEGRFEKALGLFKKALWHCGCHRDQLKQLKAAGMSLDLVADDCSSCSCKDFLDAARRPSLSEPAWAVWNVADERVTAVYSLAERNCTCGSGQKRCASLVHLQVLDACSAACHELGDFKQALNFGTMMINIAPGKPTGYLRTAKVVIKYAPPHLKGFETDIVRSLYKQGLANVKRLGNDDDQGYKILTHNYKKMSRCDIFLRLPAELQYMVSRELSVRDRIHCTCVSKAWKVLWENTPRFWRQLHFDKGMKPRHVHLRRVIRKYSSRQATHIAIKDCGGFWLNAESISVITDDLPCLRHVELGCSTPERLQDLIPIRHRTTILPNVTESRSLNYCETLVLNRLVARSGLLLEHVLEGARHTLKDLAIYETPSSFQYISTQMANLTCLKLVGPSSPIGSNPLDVAFSLDATPNITHLYLDKYSLTTIYPRPPRWSAMLQKLQSLVIGANITTLSGFPTSHSYFPPLPSTIKMIDFLSDDDVLARQLFAPASNIEADDTTEEAIRFEHLESFRCVVPLQPQDILRVVSGATNLQTFEIGSWEDRGGSDTVEACILPAALADRVRTAGLHKFCWQNGYSYHHQYTGQPFIDWLAASFPNVDTVSAYPQRYPNADMVIFSLVQSGRYKTIYQSCLAGAARDQLLSLAEEKGVRIVQTPENFRPPVFPWPDGR